MFYIALSLTIVGGLLEGESWSPVLEFGRIFSLATAGVTLLLTGDAPRPAVVLALVWLAVSALWLRSAWRSHR